MKIAMIGTGAMGQVCAAQLARSGEVEELRLCDIRPDVAERTAGYLRRHFGFEGAGVHDTDASDLDSLLAAIDGTSVVVNMGSPRFNLTVGEAALLSGAHYVDIGLDTPDEWHYPRELEDPALGERWRAAGLAALKSFGLSPGIVDILAKYAADRLDAVRDIRIRVFGDVETVGGFALWSEGQATLDKLTVPRALVDGRMRDVAWDDGEEVYSFLGLRDAFPRYDTEEWACAYISHPEVNYLSRTIGKGLVNCDIKKGSAKGHGDVKVLKDRGLFSREPVAVRGARVAPADLLVALAPPTLFIEESWRKIEEGLLCDYLFYVVDTQGERAGRAERQVRWFHLSARQASRTVPGASAVAYTTATPAAIAAVALAKGELESRGVFIPEMLPRAEIDLLVARLSESGIEIHERIERTI